MKSLIFIAPPAAGKGTQSEKVCAKYNVPHISTGDLLRNASNKSSERGKYIKEQMETGKLISDDLTIELLIERLKEDDCTNGYILDGFPRNASQAKVYDDILAKLNKQLGIVIYLKVPKELAKKRIVGRLSCPKCGAVYNTMFEGAKPQIDGICDECGTELLKRSDDNEATFEIRYETYLKQTEPLLNFYKAQNALYEVDSSQDTDEVFKEVVKLLEKKA
jgi:adenylate kinase